MDFLNLKQLFREKHGDEKYNEIKKKIQMENTKDYNAEYLSIIFKIAFFQYFRIDKDRIKYIIEKLHPGKSKNVDSIMVIHKNSIKEIKKCIKEATKD